MKRFIISAEKSNNGYLINKLNTKELYSKLQDITQHIIKVQGKYQGVKEISFLVELDEKDYVNYGTQINTVFNLARKYKQDSILMINDDYTAYLLYINSTRKESIGYFIEVDKDTALLKDAYSKINGKYFITIDDNFKLKMGA